nr:hypothetical protein OH826_19490 [Streptomyces sp. NBC_00899]
MMGKAEATTTLRRLGLDTTVTIAYQVAVEVTPEAIHHDLGAGDRYVARASTAQATLNLPRLIDATAAEVCQWAAQLPPGVGALLQKYAELAFCGQLAVYPGLLVTEIVSGMWEMRASQQPFRITGTWDTTGAVTWTAASAPVRAQQCTWLYEPESRTGHVEDWMIAATQRWTEQSTPALRELLTTIGHPFGVKFHYTSSAGIAAQNLYDDVPPPHALHETVVPEHCPVISDVHQNVAPTREVLLDVSVAREDAALFDGLIARLLAAGVTRVYLRSGLLSHAAIRLREASLDVRSAR